MGVSISSAQSDQRTSHEARTPTADPRRSLMPIRAVVAVATDQRVLRTGIGVGPIRIDRFRNRTGSGLNAFAIGTLLLFTDALERFCSTTTVARICARASP